MTVTPQWGRPDDAEREARLNAMKRRATSLLGVALLVFIAASWFEPQYPWLGYLRATAEASLVGGLADWFAVTALFRHPLGVPIPHTAIIPTRRAKIIESIVSMVQDEWLSPEVIGARLSRISPSDMIVDWLRDPAHVERLGGPLRDFLQALAGVLTEPEVVEFVERTMQRQLREVPLDASAGRWLARVAASDSFGAAFQSAARSLANLARQPATADALQAWLNQAAAA